MKYAIYVLMLVLAFTSCGGGNSTRHIRNLGNTPYQEDSILVTYANQPERALVMLDSALLLGHISDYRSQFIRAKIYGRSLKQNQLDSAILISQQLLRHDSVVKNLREQFKRQYGVTPQEYRQNL